MSRRGWRLVVGLLCWLLMAPAITRTRIQDTLYNADGTLASGLITVSWRGFTGTDGSTVAGNSITLRVVNGVLKVDLAPNPSGTSYAALYLLDGKSTYTETWVVPQSGAPVRLPQVRVAGPPALAGGTGSGSPANIYTAGGNTGVGPTAFTPSSTLEVYDATAATGVTRQILRGGAGQGNNPLLEFHFGNSSNAVGFRVPPLSSSTTYTLPAQDGLPGTLLHTDGAGNLSWSPGQSAVTGEFYQTFQNAAASLAQRHTANFRNGLQAADNAGSDRTDVSPVYGTGPNTIAQGNDTRFSDARTPLPHAATHGAGGSDPVTPGSIGALKNTSDTISSAAPSSIGLVVKGATGQVASLQEWHDSNDNLLASITSTGRVFFPEAFFSARPGDTATSLFYQVGGLNRFSTTTFANAYNFNRYDDNGNFKDTPLQLARSGDISINTSLIVTDPTPSTGATRIRVTAGAGQGSTNLQEWQNNSGTLLSSVASNGFFQFPSGQKHGNGAQAQFFTGTTATGDCASFDANGNIVSAGGSCGSVNVPVFQDAVTPAGTIDGTNAVFTLPAAPSPAGSLELTRNGVVQKPGGQFNLSAGTITFTSQAIPQPGDTLLAWYRAGTSAPSSAAGGDLGGTYPNPGLGVLVRNCKTWDGVKGDGTTDDTANIVTCIANADAAGTAAYLPTGTYIFSGTNGAIFTSTNNGSHIAGDGKGRTILKYKTGQTLAATITAFNLNGKDQIVEGITIDMNTVTLNGFNQDAVRFGNGCFRCRARNIEILNVNGAIIGGGRAFNSNSTTATVAFTTTLGTAVSAPGSATVTPGSMAGIYQGRRLTIGGATEDVVVTAVSATTFTAPFANTHLGSDSVTGIVQSEQYNIVEDFYIHDSFQGAGFVLNSGGNIVRNGRIINVGQADMAHNHAFYLQGGNNRVEDVYMDGIGGFCFNIDANTNIEGSGDQIVNNKCIDPGGGYVYLAADTSSGGNPQVPNGVNLARYTTFHGNTWKLSNQIANTVGAAGLGGMHLAAPALVLGDVFEDAGTAYGSQWLRIDSDNVQVTGGTRFTTTNCSDPQVGIMIGTVAAKNIKISGDQFEFTTCPADVIAIGNNAVTVSDISVTDNHFTVATAAQKAAINLGNGSGSTINRFKATGNTFTVSGGNFAIRKQNSSGSGWEFASNTLNVSGGGDGVLLEAANFPTNSSFHDNQCPSGAVNFNSTTPVSFYQYNNQCTFSTSLGTAVTPAISNLAAHGNSTKFQLSDGTGTSGNLAKYDANGNVVDGGVAASGVGSVTSVGLSMPSDFTVSSSPVTGAGTISVTANTQSANTFKAGPSSGSAAAPAYRAIAAADLPTVINTADQGYFFGLVVYPPLSDVTMAAFTSNQHSVWQFVLPYAVTIGRVTYEVTTASGTCGGACHMQLGLWNAACTSTVLTTGILTSGGTPNINSNTVQTVTLSSPVTLAPGVYWLAMTTDSTSLILRGIVPASHAINQLNNQTNKKFGTASAGSTGAFPSTCGTLTASSAAAPMVLFER